MRVYKFGGASVKDIGGIENLVRIVALEPGNLVIVVSALGKTTNALERVLAAWNINDDSYNTILHEIATYHRSVIGGLQMGGGAVEEAFNNSLSDLQRYLNINSPSGYDFDYDQVVSCGELWSTMIVAGYMNSAGVKTQWTDIRTVLKTDNRYRDAAIMWEQSERKAKEIFTFRDVGRYVTQGFIGGTAEGYTTTLGREGSDYTAALLANMLDAECVVVWKDVPGLLNADPEWLSDAEILREVSYKEAVEMTFSGAKVIHPKTIKPLHNKKIPLFVRSFVDSSAPGTVIREEVSFEHGLPVYVKKENQVLISILPDDFSFATSDNMSRIFIILNDLGIKVNLVQASALSIDVCVDYEREKLTALARVLGGEFRIAWNEDAEMLTIRHFTPEAIEKITAGRDKLLVQYTRNMVRFVVR